jgi:hypothetical protein
LVGDHRRTGAPLVIIAALNSTVSNRGAAVLAAADHADQQVAGVRDARRRRRRRARASHRRAPDRLPGAEAHRPS